MKNNEPTFAERMSTSKKAKQAQLEKARAMAPANTPGFAERQSARRATDVARNARIGERKAAKVEIEKHAAEEAAHAAQAKLDEEAFAAERRAAQEVELAETQRRKLALEAERKAERDLRYAARKARKK